MREWESMKVIGRDSVAEGDLATMAEGPKRVNEAGPSERSQNAATDSGAGKTAQM